MEALDSDQGRLRVSPDEEEKGVGGRRRTRHNWRTAPSLNAGLEGSRSVCCRAFTCRGNPSPFSTRKQQQQKASERAIWGAGRRDVRSGGGR